MINISSSLVDTVSCCHGQIADGSSLQVSTRVRSQAEAESNLISETMTWLCARARPRPPARMERGRSAQKAAVIRQAHMAVRCFAGCVYKMTLLIQKPKRKKCLQEVLVSRLSWFFQFDSGSLRCTKGLIVGCMVDTSSARRVFFPL